MNNIANKKTRSKKQMPGFPRTIIFTLFMAVVIGSLVYSQLTASAATDTTPPALNNTEATNKQLIYLTFSEPIKDLATTSPVGTVSVPGLSINNVSLMNDARILQLTVSSMVYGNVYPTPNSYTVTVNNIFDLSNNKLTSANQTFDSFTPHGKYSPYTYTSGNSTRMCAHCHSAHNAAAGELLSSITIKKVCFVCHGYAGISAYKVENQFYNWTDTNVGTSVYSTSLHKSLDSDSAGQNVLTCIDCHDPHGTRRLGTNNIYPKLLNAKNVFGAVYTTADGNWFCLACHGTVQNGSNWLTFSTGVSMQSYYNSTGGNHEWGMMVSGGADNAVHYDKDNYSPLKPATGTQVTCITCHEKHGSANNKLTVNDSAYSNRPTSSNAREKLCYKCHNTSTYNSMSGINIKGKFDATGGTTSKHNIFDETNLGLTCSSCHGPHTVARRTFLSSSSSLPSDISDPNNTKNNYNSASGNYAGFCNRCHDVASNTQTLVQTTNSTAIVPYNVFMPNTTFTSSGTGWNKKQYYDAYSGNTNAGHYQQGIMCNNCHDPHGAANVRLEVYGEDPNSAPTATSGMCLRCHGGVAGVTPAGPNVYTNGLAATGSFPTKHPTLTTLGVHGDTETILGMARHAECVDCHDPHGAKNGAAEQDPIRGATGVNIINWNGANYSNWGTTTPTWSLAPITSSDYQYELCFKCHSKFTYAAPPNNPSTNNGIVFIQTDVAKDFATTNYAKHIVVPGSVTGMDPTKGNFIGSKYNFSATGTSTVLKCTYCHGASTGTVKGPHGSGNKFMLVAPWYPYQSTLPAGRTTYTGSGTNDKNDLCFLCHSYAFYVSGNSADGSLTGTSGLDSKPHNDTAHRQSYGCSACHGGMPHSWLRGKTVGNHGVPLAIQGDPAPYNFGTGLTAVQLREPGTWNGAAGHNGCTVAWGCT